MTLHIVRKSRCEVSLHPVCILKVFTKCLCSLHKGCICFRKLITKCALSVPDADIADLGQTLQTWCNKTPVRPVLARPPCIHHRPDCAQTLQNSRPCPKPPGSKRPPSQPPVSSRHGSAKIKAAKKYRCLTRSDAAAETRPCLQMRLNSANFETLPGTNGI